MGGMTQQRMLRDTGAFRSGFVRGGEDECWEWTKRKDRDGYGRVRGYLAHRIAFTVHTGRQPQDYVCHTCDNPGCVNPKHLWEGTNSDNMHDMSHKKRGRGQDQTHCVHGHEYTEENTYYRTVGVNRRDCRACIRIRVAAYKARKA